jgi:hypothetical protein
MGYKVIFTFQQGKGRLNTESALYIQCCYHTTLRLHIRIVVARGGDVPWR